MRPLCSRRRRPTCPARSGSAPAAASRPGAALCGAAGCGGPAARCASVTQAYLRGWPAHLTLWSAPCPGCPAPFPPNWPRHHRAGVGGTDPGVLIPPPPTPPRFGFLGWQGQLGQRTLKFTQGDRLGLPVWQPARHTEQGLAFTRGFGGAAGPAPGSVEKAFLCLPFLPEHSSLALSPYFAPPFVGLWNPSAARI